MRIPSLFALSLRLLLACAASLGMAAPPPSHVVVRPVANLLSAPRETADVVSQALLSERVEELERREDWVRIQGEDQYTGWIQAAALRPLGAGERYPAGPAVETVALAANLYAEPDITKHAPVLTAPFGILLERVPGKDTARWIQVRLPDRRLVWIQAGDVRTDRKPLDLQASLDLAKRFLGINYTWGGRSSFGFDCSGFTQTILRSRGVLMPRDARLQIHWPGLTEVAKASELQAGDLLFFGKDLGHVTHTGMSLGADQFIHDTSHEHPWVQVSSLKDPHWAGLLVAMRRLK